jgi:MFS family permease
MSVNATNAGFMVSAALFGMAVGSVLLGTLATRIGRRWAIALCVLCFSLFSALAALTANPLIFAVTRFIAGLGLGGIAPIIAAHMTEYAPRHLRSMAVTLTFSGWLADRTSIKAVLISMNLLAAVSIGLLGYTTSTVMLYLLIGVTGGCTIGAQIVSYAYAGQYYPINIRSAGIGWAAGLGHSGAIFAPILIGILIGMALPLHYNFIAMAIPAVIAAIAVAFIDRPETSALVLARESANH